MPRSHKDNAESCELRKRANRSRSELASHILHNLCASASSARTRARRHAKGEELHRAVETTYAFLLGVPSVRDLVSDLMTAAQGSAVIPGIVMEDEMETLRNMWVRRVLNLSSDSEASSAETETASASTSESARGFITLPIFFATNRNILGGHVRRYYGTVRADKISYGCAWLSLPDTLGYGDVEDASTWRYSRRRKGVPRSKIVHLTTVPLIEEKCFVKMKTLLGALGEKEAILFVHGYNSSLANACHRMAQSVAAYTADEGNVMWAVPDLLHIIKMLRVKMGMEKVHLLGHSMGSRALIYALLRMHAHDFPPGSAQIGRLVLAAPDFDMGEFTQLGPELAGLCERMTLYCSSDDQALHLSRSLHGGYPRLGDFRGFLLETNHHRVGAMVGQHIDAIDTTGTDSSWLRHAYVFTTCGIIMDCCMVLKGVPPTQRSSLVMRRLPSGQHYWVVACSPTGAVSRESVQCNRDMVYKIRRSLTSPFRSFNSLGGGKQAKAASSAHLLMPKSASAGDASPRSGSDLDLTPRLPRRQPWQPEPLTATGSLDLREGAEQEEEHEGEGGGLRSPPVLHGQHGPRESRAFSSPGGLAGGTAAASAGDGEEDAAAAAVAEVEAEAEAEANGGAKLKEEEMAAPRKDGGGHGGGGDGGSRLRAQAGSASRRFFREFAPGLSDEPVVDTLEVQGDEGSFREVGPRGETLTLPVTPGTPGTPGSQTPGTPGTPVTPPVTVTPVTP
eukprot:jgi/Mesen1/1743/ME001390S00742